MAEHGLTTNLRQANLATSRLNNREEVGDDGEGKQRGRQLANALGDRDDRLLQPLDGFLSCGGYTNSSGIEDDAKRVMRRGQVDG